ncbi:MAG: hypothetical protein Q4P06_04595 [Actinomycetaceae bacterium]|nr:hypothetical protein [Actinomycetaceae bacterium]
METSWLGGGAAIIAVALVSWWWWRRRRRHFTGEDGADFPQPAAGLRADSDPGASVKGASAGESAGVKVADSDFAANSGAQQAAVAAGSDERPASDDSSTELPASSGADTKGEVTPDACDPSADASSESVPAVASAPGSSATGEEQSAGATGEGQSAGTPGDAGSPQAGTPGDADSPQAGTPDDAEPSDDTVLVKAQPLTAERAGVELAQARSELWLNRWLLGEQACSALEEAVTAAQQALDSWYLTADAGPLALRPLLEQVRHHGASLQQLRTSQFQAALTTAPVFSDEDDPLPPAAASLSDCDMNYLSTDPSAGLGQLAFELRRSLTHTRLEVARLAPTAGSVVSSGLRHWLSQATQLVVSVEDEVRRCQDNPGGVGAGQIRGWETQLMRVLRRRQMICLYGNFLNAREWAATMQDQDTWQRAADLALHLTRIQRDTLLLEGAVSGADLQLLARIGARMQGQVHPHTGADVVEQCEALWQGWRGQFHAVQIISEPASQSPADSPETGTPEEGTPTESDSIELPDPAANKPDDPTQVGG